MDELFSILANEYDGRDLPARIGPALIAYVQAADEVRAYPAHPEFLSEYRHRVEAYDASRAALLAALKGEKGA